MLRILTFAVPVMLAGYAVGDRGFAYLASVPGTPLFAGELILLLGFAYMGLATGYLKMALRSGLPMLFLLGFAAWGLARTLPLIPVYGLDSIRDAALWYYALMAVVVATLVVAVPELPHRWARAYVPLLVVVLLWSPLSLLLAGSSSPTVPGSGGIPLFSHKPGNTAVAATTAIAFLWLVPTHSVSRGARVLLTALATVVILAVGTQNRGGLVAALAALALAGLMMGRSRWKLGGVMLGTVVIGFMLAWGSNFQVPGAQGRSYSVAQLFDNASSLTGAQSSGNLNGTVQFRDALWSGVLDLASEQGALPTGLGFGPNLAQELGVSVGVSDPLRSPHNSHVDILARMGLIGGALWVGFWGSWYWLMFRRSRAGPGGLSPEKRGILKVCTVAATVTLINSYFDPTLESPQVAIWLYALVGLGLGVVASSALPGRNGAGAGARP